MRVRSKKKKRNIREKKKNVRAHLTAQWRVRRQWSLSLLKTDTMLQSTSVLGKSSVHRNDVDKFSLSREIHGNGSFRISLSNWHQKTVRREDTTRRNGKRWKYPSNRKLSIMHRIESEAATQTETNMSIELLEITRLLIKTEGNYTNYSHGSCSWCTNSIRVKQRSIRGNETNTRRTS